MWHLSAKKALHFLWHRAIFNSIVSRNESGALAPLFFLDISPGKARRERRSEMKKVTQLCAELAAPFVEAAGCTLWDVEYVHEAGTWYLRVFIDAPGGVKLLGQKLLAFLESCPEGIDISPMVRFAKG